MKQSQFRAMLTQLESLGGPLEELTLSVDVDERGRHHIYRSFKPKGFVTKKVTFKQLVENPDLLCQECCRDERIFGSLTDKLETILEAYDRVEEELEKFSSDKITLDGYRRTQVMTENYRYEAERATGPEEPLRQWALTLYSKLTDRRGALVKENSSALEAELLRAFIQNHYVDLRGVSNFFPEMKKVEEDAVELIVQAAKKGKQTFFGFAVSGGIYDTLRNVAAQIYPRNEKLGLSQMPAIFAPLFEGNKIPLDEPLSDMEFETACRLCADGGVYSSLEEAAKAAKTI